MAMQKHYKNIVAAYDEDYRTVNMVRNSLLAPVFMQQFVCV